MNTDKLRDQIVVKSNAMVNALGSLSLQQTRFVAWLASSLPHGGIAPDKPFDLEIDVSAFSAAFDIDGRLAYTEVRKISRVLQQKIIHIPLGTDVVEVGILTKARYRAGEGRVWIRLDEDLLPHILGLREQFTKYRIRDVYQFSSAHTWRVYELLRQYKDIGRRELEVDELKQKLGVLGRYSVLADLRKRVIDPAVDEINSTSDIFVQYDQKKRGRRIVAFLFMIFDNSGTKTPIQQVREAATRLDSGMSYDPELARVLREDYGVSDNQARQLANLARHDRLRVLDMLPRLRERYNALVSKKTSLGGYVFRALRSELSQLNLPLEVSPNDRS